MIKKIILSALFILVGSFTALSVASADSIPAAPVWKTLGGYILPINSSNGLNIPVLGGSGTRCVQTDNSGNLAKASAACGSGGGGSSSVGPLNVLQASDGAGGFIATGTPQLTVGNILATSTTATSTFANGINATGGCIGTSVDGCLVSTSTMYGNIYKASGASYFGSWNNNNGMGLPYRNSEYQEQNDGITSIHGTVIVGDYFYGSSGGGKLIKNYTKDITQYSTTTTSCTSIGSLAYDSVGKKIYGLCINNNVLQIDPSTLANSAVITGTGGGSQHGSIATDGTYIYVLTSETPSVIKKYNISGFSLASSASLTGTVTGHSLSYDGTNLYATTLDGEVAKINPSTLSFTVAPTNSCAITDDFATTPDYIYVGCENLNYVIRVSKSNVNTQLQIPVAHSSYGVYFDGKYLWNAANDAATIERIDPVTLEESIQAVTVTAGVPNEILSDGENLFFTTWTNGYLYRMSKSAFVGSYTLYPFKVWVGGSSSAAAPYTPVYNVDIFGNIGNSQGNLLIQSVAGKVGVGATTTPWRTLSVVGSSDLGNNAYAGYFTATSTDATSTFAGPISVTTQSNANISFSSGAFLNSVLKLWGGTEGNVSLGADGQESINVQPDGFATAHGKLHELDGGICASDPTVGGCIAFGSGANVGFGGDSIALGDNTTATYDHSFVINPTGDSDFAPNTLNLGASGGVFIQGQGGLTASTSGNIGIGTTSPYAKLSVVGQVVGQYFTATSSTASAFPYASTTALSAQTICLTGDTCRTTWPTGGGSAFPFTNQSYGVSTSTTVAFLNGLFSTASSTFSGSFHLPNIANGMLTDYGGLVSSAATSTLSTISGSLTLTSQVTGVLPVANGGTNASSFTTSGNGVYWDGTRLVTAPTATAVTYPYASSTGISSTYASSTIGNIGTLTLPNLATPAGTFLAADANGKVIATTTPSGGGSSLAWMFALTGNATSTLTGFNGGLTAYASTTIGGGAQASGLTVSGGATTTGNMQVGLGATSAFTILSSNGFGGFATSTPWRTLSVNGSSDLGINAYAGYFTATTTTASSLPYASTTAISSSNLTSGNCVQASTGGLLTTTSSGCAASAYPFSVATNATSTLVGFNGGLTAYASSTIGNGTGSGGLTISGQSTTTGNAYFAASVGIGTTSPASAFTSIAASSTVASDKYKGNVFSVGGKENTTEKVFYDIDQWGHHIVSGDIPTLSSCSTGTISSDSNDVAGKITFAIGQTSCGVTFAHAYPAGSHVDVLINQDTGTPGSVAAQSVSTSGFTLQGLSFDVFSYYVIATQ